MEAVTPTILTRDYTFDARPNLPFLVTAKRYWVDGATHDANALTLVFAHATGFCKEQWEPIVEDIYHRLSEAFLRNNSDGSTTVKIREMWSIDAPNHGDSGVLNEQTLQWGYDDVFSWDIYGRAVHALLSGHGSGIETDFRQHNIVGIGHSLGAIAIMLSTTFQPPVPYTFIHLFEPMMMGRKWTESIPNFVLEGVLKRRDVWQSKEEAFKIMKSRPGWKSWDERVLRLLVNHGLRSLPTLNYPDKTDGVTLKCSKKQEAAVCRDPTSRVLAYNLLRHLLRQIPTHIAYGSVSDYLPAECQDDVLHNASGGIENFASVVRVEGAGHLVTHTHPSAVAGIIWDTLVREAQSDRIYANSRKLTRAKL